MGGFPASPDKDHVVIREVDVRADPSYNVILKNIKINYLDNKGNNFITKFPDLEGNNAQQYRTVSPYSDYALTVNYVTFDMYYTDRFNLDLKIHCGCESATPGVYGKGFIISVYKYTNYPSDHDLVNVTLRNQDQNDDDASHMVCKAIGF